MAEWHRAAAADEVPAGSLLGVEVDGERVVLARVDGAFYALQDRCSHADFPLHDGILEGTILECVHHGARFDVCTGKAKRLPAIRKVPVYPVEVRDGDVFIQLP